MADNTAVEEINDSPSPYQDGGIITDNMPETSKTAEGEFPKKRPTITDLPQELIDKSIEPLLLTKLEISPFAELPDSDWEALKRLIALRRVKIL